MPLLAGRRGLVWIAAVNGPGLVVVSGRRSGACGAGYLQGGAQDPAVADFACVPLAADGADAGDFAAVAARCPTGGRWSPVMSV